MPTPPKPLILAILDGWGCNQTTEANAIAMATKPCWDKLWANYPHTTLEGSGTAVGLPAGQMGNSEVGHLIMGAGRLVYQDLSRVDKAIEDGDFFTNPVLIHALTSAKQHQRRVHVIGLLSPGGVHSHENHIFNLFKLAKQLDVPQLCFHAFLDGRDTPPQSALRSIEKATQALQNHPGWAFASVCGRYYAMDRDKRFERTQMAYDLITAGKANYTANDAKSALENAYQRGETDEFVKPTAILQHGKPLTMEDDDCLIFMNFRADRARQLTDALSNPQFQGFSRKRIAFSHIVTLSEYDSRFAVEVAYPPIPLTNILAHCLSAANLKQLRIAETEKYAHVTFFFNGGVEEPVAHEERHLIPSPAVATYDLAPAMSAAAITDVICDAIAGHNHDVIICNFANPDMVGHTGNLEATIKAIETIDQCLAKITAALKTVGGEILITADHGNAEKMFDNETNQPHTAHTSDPVPFIYFGPRSLKIAKNDGKLSDIAPTILYLLGISPPPEMTGTSLLKSLD